MAVVECWPMFAAKQRCTLSAGADEKPAVDVRRYTRRSVHRLLPSKRLYLSATEILSYKFLPSLSVHFNGHRPGKRKDIRPMKKLGVGLLIVTI